MQMGEPSSDAQKQKKRNKKAARRGKSTANNSIEQAEQEIPPDQELRQQIDGELAFPS